MEGPVETVIISRKTHANTKSKTEEKRRWNGIFILFRLIAMAAKRHSSVAHRMPRFLIIDNRCSRFKTENLPSLHIFRLRIIE